MNHSYIVKINIYIESASIKFDIRYYYRSELGCLSRKEIIESVNQSLRNLGLEYIDLLIIHKNDPNCPLEGNIYFFFSLSESILIQMFEI